MFFCSSADGLKRDMPPAGSLHPDVAGPSTSGFGRTADQTPALPAGKQAVIVAIKFGPYEFRVSPMPSAVTCQIADYTSEGGPVVAVLRRVRSVVDGGS